MIPFVKDTYIYKKKYFHQQLKTDYSCIYLITNIENKETSFGISYLASLENNEVFELAFVEYHTGKNYIYAEKYEPTCICF